MVAEKGYTCIEFARIMNLVGLHKEEAITKEKFIELLEPSRQELMKQYLDPKFDVNDCIKNDPDYKSTYDGYAKFLKKDLQYSSIKNACLSGKKFKAKVHETAKAMIARGVVSVTLVITLFIWLTNSITAGLCRDDPAALPRTRPAFYPPFHRADQNLDAAHSPARLLLHDSMALCRGRGRPRKLQDWACRRFEEDP